MTALKLGLPLEQASVYSSKNLLDFFIKTIDRKFSKECLTMNLYVNAALGFLMS